MKRSPPVRILMKRVGFIGFGYVTLVGFLQGNCEKPVDLLSKCPLPTRNAVASQLQLQPYHYEPHECPVRVKAGQSPTKNSLLEVWDVGHHFAENHPMSTSFKSATGQPMGSNWISYFDGFSVNPPAGTLAARMSGFYSAGWAGFPPTVPNPTDTAISVTTLNSQTAEIKQPLPYKLEETPPVTGPTSITWGAPADFKVDGSYVRRGVTVRWRLNGQLVQSTSIPVTGLYSYFSPGFSSVGTHKVSMISTSALGRVHSVTRTIRVNAPAGCNPPPVPIRSGPDSTGSPGGYHPIAPGSAPRTSCPP